MNNNIKIARELVKIAKSLSAGGGDEKYVVLKEDELTICTLVQDGYARSYNTEEEAKQEWEKIGYPLVLKKKDFDAYVEAVRTIRELTRKATGKNIAVKK